MERRTERDEVDVRDTPRADVLASVLIFENHPSALQVLLCLRGQTVRPARTLLIDNGSTVAFEEFLRVQGVELWDDEEIVRLSENRGVGAGHNVALSRASEGGHRDVWLLEHDTFAVPGCLAALLAQLDGRDDAAIHPLLARNDYERQLRERGLLPGGERPLRDLVGEGTLTFNGLLLSTQLAERLGPVREDLFIGYEDREWERQFGGCGARLELTAEVLAIHPSRGAARFPEPQSPVRAYYTVRNRLWLEREHDGRVPVSTVLRSIAGAVRDLTLRDVQLAKARVRGTMDGVRGS